VLNRCSSIARSTATTMRMRLAALMHETFGIPLVGTDGSGGTVGGRLIGVPTVGRGQGTARL